MQNKVYSHVDGKANVGKRVHFSNSAYEVQKGGTLKRVSKKLRGKKRRELARFEAIRMKNSAVLSELDRVLQQRRQSPVKKLGKFLHRWLILGLLALVVWVVARGRRLHNNQSS